MALMFIHLAIKGVIIFQIIGNVYSETITIYEDDNFKGDFTHLPVSYNGRCSNIPPHWENKVSGMNTGGICVDLFAERDCNGEKRIRLYPGNFGHRHLLKWHFDNILKSIRACEKHINETNHNIYGNSVAVFEEKGFNFTGHFLYLNIESCKNLPESWRNRVSATITFGKCYQYYTGLNCTGESIVQYPGTPSHEDFSKWQFDDVTNSIGICEHEKQNTDSSVTTVNHAVNFTAFSFSSEEVPVTLTSKEMENNVDTATPRPESGFKSETLVIISVSVVVIILLLLLICIIILLFRYFKKRTDFTSMGDIPFQILNQKYIQNFMNGNPSAFENIEYNLTDGIFRAQNMPYNAEVFEIPLECLQIDKKNPLGSGEFGTVSKAKVMSPNFTEPFEAAVKMVKTGADPGYVKALLDELKIMMYLCGHDRTNQHPHIVNLVGACTQRIYNMEPYIILEFCSQGSLEQYLRKSRKTFRNQIDTEGNIQPRQNLLYVNDKVTDTDQLLKWARDITEGMGFLSQKKVIHGDLAARNILLDDHLNAKVSDFGLSRQLYQYTQYVKKQQAPLPWRWMAVESLQDMTFSSQSDVWAFGVTLWEIFALAQIPYPGIVWSTNFLITLKNGVRMSKPKYATSDIYRTMLDCWEELPDERPTFAELREKLSHLSQKFSHVYLEVSN